MIHQSKTLTAMNYVFPSSELIINGNGTIYHLCLQPENLADKVILVGDPKRVETIAQYFDSTECDIMNREYHTITGTYKGKRISAVSTGVGCGNVDIVMNEMDALANIDFSTRTEKEDKHRLEIVRIGTCGGLQPETPLGSYICSVESIGLDGLLNFYKGRNEVCDLELEEAFVRHMSWSGYMGAPHPYVAIADCELSNRIAGDDMIKGITVSAPGFFGPQGRRLRIQPADDRQNEKIESFEYKGAKILNYEMESSAVAGFASLLGHRATSVCMVVADRYQKEAGASRKNTMAGLIQKVLERI